MEKPVAMIGFFMPAIDLHVSQHPEEKSRSAFLASAALRMLGS